METAEVNCPSITSKEKQIGVRNNLLFKKEKNFRNLQAVQESNNMTLVIKKTRLLNNASRTHRSEAEHNKAL